MKPMKFKPGYVTKRIFSYLNARLNTLSFKGVLLAITKSNIKQLKPVDVLFWCHDNHRIAVRDGKKFSPLIDTIIENIEGKLSHLTLGMPFSKFFGPQCYGNVIIYNRTILFGYIKRFILQQTLTIKYSERDSVVEAWKKILDKISPKAIIGVNPSIEFCIAAKQKNIWIADMQHGILAPGNYYELKKRNHINQLGWPNEILCWDQYSKDYVETNLAPYVMPRIIGHPGYFRSNNCSDNFSKSLIETENAVKISVLVTLTWHLPELYQNDSIFQEIGMPSSLANYIKTYGNFCNWNLRLHPHQLMKKEGKTLKSLYNIFQNLNNVNWDFCNNVPLYNAFANSTVHVTFDSASAREAAILGINTAILDNNVENATIYFGDLIEENRAKIINVADHTVFTNWIVESHQSFKSKQRKNENNTTTNDMFSKFIDELQSRVINARPNS